MRSYRNMKLKISDKKLLPYIKMTMTLYNEIVLYLLPKIGYELYKNEYKNSKTRFNEIEKLFHNTKFNTRKYEDFDTKFQNLPRYLRRTIIQAVIGIHLSFNTRFETWKKEFYEDWKKNSIEDEKGNKIPKPPTFSLKNNLNPIFYKGNMFEENREEILSYKKEKNIRLKLYIGNHRYQYFSLKTRCKNTKRFLNSLEKFNIKNPKIIKIKNYYYIEFTYEYEGEYTLTKENLQEIKEKKYEKRLKLIGIDLGIKEPLTRNYSTISFTKNQFCKVDKQFFIHKDDVFKKNTAKFDKLLKRKNRNNQKISNIKNVFKVIQEKNELRKKEDFIILNSKIKKHLNIKLSIYKKRRRNIYQQIKNYQLYFNNYIVNQLSLNIEKYEINLIVMENLDSLKKSKNKVIKERFHYWQKEKNVKRIINMSERYDCRYRRISPRYTSQTCNTCFTYHGDYRDTKNSSIFKCLNTKCQDVNIIKDRDKNRALSITNKALHFLIGDFNYTIKKFKI